MLSMFLVKWLGEKTFSNIQAVLSSKWFYIILGLALLVGYSYYYGYNYEKAKWQAQVVKINQQAKAQHDVDAKAIQSNQLDSLLLETSIKQIQEDSHEQLVKANTATASALNALSLQHRTHRPAEGANTAPDSSTNQPTTNSTGRNLYDDDGAFLTRFAGQVQLLVVKHNECIAAYNKVFDSVNKQKQTELEDVK